MAGEQPTWYGEPVLLERSGVRVVSERITAGYPYRVIPLDGEHRLCSTWEGALAWVTHFAGPEPEPRTARIRIACLVADDGTLLDAMPERRAATTTLAHRQCLIVEAHVSIREPAAPPVVSGTVVEGGER